ncbi:MAG: hypothetical protein OXT07_13395, partial [bacterium]|nr:hypothetical protein [bacterium]
MNLASAGSGGGVCAAAGSPPSPGACDASGTSPLANSNAAKLHTAAARPQDARRNAISRYTKTQIGQLAGTSQPSGSVR